MIHIGQRDTLRTLCQKPVKGRWWVEAEHTKIGYIGNFFVSERIKPYGVTCKKCLLNSGAVVDHKGWNFLGSTWYNKYMENRLKRISQMIRQFLLTAEKVLEVAKDLKKK